MCSPFERRGLDEKAYLDDARKSREDMILRSLNVWRNPLGSASLTAVWDSKYNGPEDLEDVLRYVTPENARLFLTHSWY
jgi:hypothetical protein